MSLPDHGEYTPSPDPCKLETTRLMLDRFGQSRDMKDYECLVILVSRLANLVEARADDVIEDLGVLE